MTDIEIVKVRKVIYNENGYQQGDLLPEYNGDINSAFDYYCKRWMIEHTDKDGELYDYITNAQVDSIEEFTIKDDDHFFIGINGSYAYEGITEDYTGFFGAVLDKYGFEEMRDSTGNIIKYSNET